MDRFLRTTQTPESSTHHTPTPVTLSDEAVIDVVSAKQVGEYRLQIVFSDGTEQVVDFASFLNTSKNPLIREYLDPKRFAAFSLEYGNLTWDEDGLCFPVADLYENTID
jgi:DUF971 family protein